MALNPDQIEKVRLVLSSSGWNDVMKPAVQNRGRLAIKALTLTRSERATEFRGADFDTDDDVLRAIIRDCEWMAVAWDNEVHVSDHNRMLAEREAAEDRVTANP